MTLQGPNMLQELTSQARLHRRILQGAGVVRGPAVAHHAVEARTGSPGLTWGIEIGAAFRRPGAMRTRWQRRRLNLLAVS